MSPFFFLTGKKEKLMKLHGHKFKWITFTQNRAFKKYTVLAQVLQEWYSCRILSPFLFLFQLPLFCIPSAKTEIATSPLTPAAKVVIKKQLILPQNSPQNILLFLIFAATPLVESLLIYLLDYLNSLLHLLGVSLFPQQSIL